MFSMFKKPCIIRHLINIHIGGDDGIDLAQVIEFKFK